jgi:hypothetical protein
VAESSPPGPISRHAHLLPPPSLTDAWGPPVRGPFFFPGRTAAPLGRRAAPTLAHARLGMAILPAGSDIHGYPTRRIRVRVQNLTRGSHPYPTRDKIGSGTGFNFYPRVLADIRNYFSFHFSAHQKLAFRPILHPYSPETLVSHTQSRSLSDSHGLTVSLSASRQKPSANLQGSQGEHEHRRRGAAGRWCVEQAIGIITQEVATTRALHLGSLSH